MNESNDISTGAPVQATEVPVVPLEETAPTQTAAPAMGNRPAAPRYRTALIVVIALASMLLIALTATVAYAVGSSGSRISSDSDFAQFIDDGGSYYYFDDENGDGSDSTNWDIQADEGTVSDAKTNEDGSLQFKYNNDNPDDPISFDVRLTAEGTLEFSTDGGKTWSTDYPDGVTCGEVDVKNYENDSSQKSQESTDVNYLPSRT